MSAKDELHEDVIQQCVNVLEQDVQDISALLRALCTPLHALMILPSKHKSHVDKQLHTTSKVTDRHISRVQSALLQRVLPTWEQELRDRSFLDIVDCWLCPPQAESRSVALIAIEAQGSFMSAPLNASVANRLARLSELHPIEVVHRYVFAYSDQQGELLQLRWDDSVRTMLKIPAKLANAAAAQKFNVPEIFEHGHFFRQIANGVERIINDHRQDQSQSVLESIESLFTKLARVGLFPVHPPSLPSQPSYFLTTLPTTRSRVTNRNEPEYAAFYAHLLSSLGSTIITQKIVASLFGHLNMPQEATSCSAATRAAVKKEAQLLLQLTGGDDELLRTLIRVVIAKDFNEAHARVLVCCVSGAGLISVADGDLDKLFFQVLEVWTSPTHIKYSVLSKHHYLTSLLLLTLSAFRSYEHAESLSLDPSFVGSIGTYLSSVDQSVRRCGMVVAEVIADRSGKGLKFDDWEGEDGNKPWVRGLRELIKERDADISLDALAETADDLVAGLDRAHMGSNTHLGDSDDEGPPGKERIPTTDAGDSDDSLSGYASSSSSRAPSPTPAELEEIEKDPTINVGVKKVQRPVYLAQLGQLIRPTTIDKADESIEADRIQMGLDTAEELIRRKRDYGTELEENAVNLVHGLVALHNNFDLDDFDTKRQAAVVALVACCPHKSAPAIIEQMFSNQYSMDQRFVMLNALALGAREIAQLPVPPSAIPAQKFSFASKRLPPAKEAKYLTMSDVLSSPVQHLMIDISRNVVATSREPSGPEPVELARERQLRIRKPTKITQLPNQSRADRRALLAPPLQKSRVPFTSVAAEYFVHPLISNFWSFLRDEQTREERTAALPRLNQYRSAGTGLIMSASILSQFLATLGVIMHAAHNAPVWGSVLAPQALELALTLGSQRISLLDDEDNVTEENGSTSEGQNTHASVLSASLELVLVILDGSLSLDDGRSLGLEHTQLLLGVGEWATKIFASLDQGHLARGGGGAQEVRLLRSTTGVCLKVEEISGRWRRSMIQFV